MSSRTEIRIKVLIAAMSAVAFAVLLTGCSADPSIVEPEAPPAGAVLRLSTVPSFTRAGFAGDSHYGSDEYAENAEETIRRVDLFFFEDEQSDKCAFYTYEVKNLDDQVVSELTVKVPIELIDKFGIDSDNKSASVYVYALVNLPAGIKVTEGEAGEISDPDGNTSAATLADLKKVRVYEPGFAGASPDSFVMRGGSKDVKLERADGKLVYVTGDILLERLASKIRLWAAIPELIYVDKSTGKTIVRDNFPEGAEGDQEYEKAIDKTQNENLQIWQSVPESDLTDNTKEINTKLYCYNVAVRGSIDGTVSGSDGDYASVDRDESKRDAVRRLVKGEDLSLPSGDRTKLDNYPYSHNTAYYSYPNSWSSTIASEAHRTYVVLELPWKNVTNDMSGEYEVYYYQIPVNALKQTETDAVADCLNPNMYYRIFLNVGMLGSRDMGTPLEIEASCEVLPWQSESVDVNIKPRRYLVVNQKEWIMNNVWTLEIPFSTSHEAEIEACYVNYFRYNDIWGTAANTGGEHNATEFEEWLDAAKGNANKGYPGLPGGQGGEGLITAKGFTSGRDLPVDRKEIKGTVESEWYFVEFRTQNITVIYNQEKYAGEPELYYKSDYFNDPYIGYTYYVGHEHPKMFQLDYLKSPAKFIDSKDLNNNDVEADKQEKAWNLYKDIYGMESIYTCEIDHEKSVIRFKHPLVWWEEVRGRSEDYTNGPAAAPTTGVYTWIPTSWVTGYWYRERTTYETRIYDNELKYYRPVLNESNNRLRDEFSRCEIIIKLKHKDWNDDSNLYHETVHITQYPSVYVQESHDYGSISNSSGSGYRGGNDYVRINGLSTYDGSRTGSWEINGDGAFGVTNSMTQYNGTNMNPNMYVVTISQLSEEDEVAFDLGDPRILTNNINLSDASFGQTPSTNVSSNTEKDATKPWTSWDMKYAPNNGTFDSAITNKAPISAPTWLNGVKGSNRQLAYYYPTDETKEGEPGSKETFIAPTIRIASSFGKIQQLDKFEARRRCAAYQEAGRPAGRWRLPTKAEVKYIAQLSAEGKIPILFGLSGREARYWTSTGIVRVDANLKVSEKDDNGVDLTADKSEAVRCVYDDWYWIKSDGTPDLTPDAPLEKENFYWGDRPKDNTQTQSILQRTLNRKEVLALDEQ